MSIAVRLAVLSLVLTLSTPTFAQTPAAVVAVGDARFTVVTRNCIRIEYSPTATFVDLPSTFAVNRAARFAAAKVVDTAGVTTISTGEITLTYKPDGQAFSGSNLSADIAGVNGVSHWLPGMDDPLNLGGTIRTLDGARGPVDLGKGLLSRSGWAVVDDSSSPLLTSDWVEARPSGSDTSDWYLFGYGSDYHAALQSLAAISGSVPLPRRYTLGAWYSRYWPYSSDDYRQIVQQYAQNDFPLDNIVMDMDWHLPSDWTGWTWYPKLIPDPNSLLAWFHQQGLHVTLNMHPADGVGPFESQYPAFMKALGQDPSTGATVPFDAGSKEYMDALSSTVLIPLEKQGVDFWWLDWQQYPDTRSIPSLTNLFWLNSYLYDQVAQDGLRGQSFSRWAGWGDQRHPIHFSGDADTGFPMLAFEVPFTATAGNVGCFFWSHDIGGHMNGRNEESYTRWCQFGATSPVLRSHSTRDPSTDRRPWLYPQWATDSMRRSFHLRSELFPYIYTSARETCKDTVPLDRPLYFDYPNEEAAYHNAQEYLLGDNLLAAPIVTKGVADSHASTQTVWFPPQSDWFNWFTGEHFAGGSNALVAADIDEFPLYARGGVLIPMQPYTQRMTTTPLTNIVLRCYPGADGVGTSSMLYEDDGQTTAYERGDSATTPLRYIRHGSTVTITIGASVGHYIGQPAQRAYTIDLYDTSQPRQVIVNGKRMACSYGGSYFIASVSIPLADRHNAQTITVSDTSPTGYPNLRTTAIRYRSHAAGVLRDPTGVDGFKKTPPSLGSILRTAPDPIRAELAANIYGIGLVRHNEGSYLYHGEQRWYLYGDPGMTFTVRTINNPSAAREITIPSSGYMMLDKTFIMPEATTSIDGTQLALPAETGFKSGDVALLATTTASSVDNSTASGAIDGVLDGFPGDRRAEWSSKSETTGAWLRLDWANPVNVSQVSLYDRPNLTDQVTSGTITFSDGSQVNVGALPNDGTIPATVTFPAKSVTWLKFTVTGVKDGTQNSGLEEIAVYATPQNP